MNRDRIALRGLNLDCVVGVYPTERDTKQPLTVDVELVLDTEPAARKERIALTVDYDALATQLVFLLKSCRFGLLETAAHALALYLLAPPGVGERRARIQAVKLRLTKPAALRGGTIASVEIERGAEFAELKRETKAFGTVDVLFETREAGIYRLNVAPGRDIPLHVHRRMQESEMVLTDGLLCQGKPVPAGTVHRWPYGAAHTYSNPTDRHQAILCVDRPRFIDADEIVVQGTPADVPAQNAYDL